MNSIQKIESSVFKKSFTDHVLKFEDDDKADILNTVQYIIFAVILVSVLHIALGRIMPEPDEMKGNFELLAEVLMHSVTFFLGLFMIDRLITFVPSYSGTNYKPVNMITLVLAFVALQADADSVLGKKMRILFQRAQNYWDGTENFQEGNCAKGGDKEHQGVKTIQPVSGMRNRVVEGNAASGNVPCTSPPCEQFTGAMNNMQPRDVMGPLPTMMMNEPVAANEVGFSSF